MLKISWVERVTNDEVLNRVQKERQLLQRIEHGQNKFLGHIIRKKAIEDLCLNGKIPGKKARGELRLHFLKQYNFNARTIIDRQRQRRDLGVLRLSLNAMYFVEARIGHGTSERVIAQKLTPRVLCVIHNPNYTNSFQATSWTQSTKTSVTSGVN